MLTAERLREIVTYDPETGTFRWRDTFAAGLHCGRTRPRAGPGDVVRQGVVPSLGYGYIMIDGKAYLAHRLAWLYVHGTFPKKGMHVDHINRDKLDNRIANLRVATYAQNMRNAKKRSDNSSGYKGVRNQNQKFTATIWKDGSPIHIGVFETKEQAARAYDDAAKVHHGEFASLNFPKEIDPC